MIKKGFTLIELLVVIVVGTIAYLYISNSLTSFILEKNKDRIYKDTYSSTSEGISKIGKLIFENATTLSGTTDTWTDSGSVLSFIKEDEYGIERTFYINLKNNCITAGNLTGKQIVMTDGISSEVAITNCIYPKNIKIEQRVTNILTELPEKILSYQIRLTLEDGTTNILKSAIFTK